MPHDESPGETPGEEIREALLEIPDDSRTIEFEDVQDDSSTSALRDLDGTEDAGPSDEEIWAEEGFDRDAEKWLDENEDAVSGLLTDPQTEEDVRRNVRVVHEARAGREAETRASQLERETAQREAREALEDPFQDPEEIADRLAEEHPDLLAPFVREWEAEDPEGAREYATERVRAHIEASEARRRAEEKEALEVVANAFDAAMARHTLSEREVALINELVSNDPGVIVGIDSPEKAAETAGYLGRAAREINRAEQEHAIKSGVVNEANKKFGWSDDELPSPEPSLRYERVFDPSGMTVGDLKREILDSPINEGLESFLKSNPASETAT